MAFSRFANYPAHIAGTPRTFAIAVALILTWAISGPFFDFSETWPLMAITGTTIVTFLMVFLTQNTQNRDSIAMQLKLDELIGSHRAAHNWALDIEELSEADLERMRRTFARLAGKAREGSTIVAELQRNEESGSR
jgi:low affinity Fe/Cu permease